MNKKLGIFLAVIIIGLVIFLGNRPGQPKQEPVVDRNNSAIIALPVAPELLPKIDDQASVTVTITPMGISSESGELRFDVVMDTHSVELDQDMMNVSVLVDDRGREYKPLRWEGAEPGGHHREGALIFNRITPTSKFVELKINEIGEVSRSFTWQF